MEMIRVSVAEIRGHLQSETYELNQKKTYAISRGGYSLNEPCRYVLPQRVGFLCRFGLKTGIEFADFGLESGMVFEGITGVHERICLIIQEMDFRKSFY